MSSRAKRGISQKLERSPELRCVIYHPARDPSSSARRRMTRELFLRLFRPRVPQRDRAIPYLFFTCGIRIEREVAEALELIALVGARVRKRWFAFRVRHFQRIGINERFEITARVGLGNSKQPVVQPNVRVNRMDSAYPVNGSFHFA